LGMAFGTLLPLPRFIKFFEAHAVSPDRTLASYRVSLPRSIVAWFAVCWELFLVAALVVGAMLIALHQETTSQRTERAAASLGRACDAVLREIRAPTPGGSSAAAEPDYSSSVMRALVGKIPDEVQPMFVFAGALAVSVRQPEAANALVRFLASPEAAPVILKAGLMPPSDR
jgi:Bacterial extracellular solute-binding protein